jgi:hypothetical protein
MVGCETCDDKGVDPVCSEICFEIGSDESAIDLLLKYPFTLKGYRLRLERVSGLSGAQR